MPHKMISQLPDAVKNNLPRHEQEIYKEAFNTAEEQYGEEDRPPRGLGRRGAEVRERRERKLGGEIAFRHQLSS